jgi:FkbM family methyltransferase
MNRKKKYYLLHSLASIAQLVGSFFPGWDTPRRIAAKLSFVRSTYGPYLLNTPGDRTFELCVEGYGRFVSDAIENQDRQFVFLDIGANLGVFSLVAAANPHCERVIAIEPLPGIFSNLEANVRRNGADKIESILGAITGTTDGSAYLAFDPRHSGMSKTVGRRPGSVRTPAISIEKLDSLFPRPSGAIVAKIDVEGSEVDVLSTLRESHIYGAIREIIIEISEANLGSAKRGELVRLLAQDGFEEMSRSGPASHYDARYRRVAAASEQSQSIYRPCRQD